MNKIQKQFFNEYTNTIVRLRDNELSELFTTFNAKEISSGHHLEKPGADKNSIFLVVSGLVRYYYLAEDGKEWNKAFISSGIMSTSFSQDFLNRPSPYGIQALENTTILIADYSSFESLYDKYHMIERLGRKIIENILIFKMNRERSFLTVSAKSRYEDFIEEYPSLLTRIPQYQIASYLGITEASLSRILRD